MADKFVMVVPENGRFEIGIGDGLYPWKHLATCHRMSDANRVATILAMHYRVRCYPTTEGEVVASQHKGDPK